MRSWDRRRSTSVGVRGLLLTLVIVALGCEFPSLTTPDDAPEYDPNKLLTDEQLRTPVDPDAQWVDPSWATWIQEHNHPIRSLVSNDFSDLQFLKPLLQGKRLVQLGEGWHGMRENSQMKVRLIKFLHQEMGFDVLAWESPIYGCYSANDQIGRETPYQLMQRCAYGVWWTSEVQDMFEYLVEARDAGNPLTLAGFDIQEKLGLTHVSERPAFLRGVVARVDPDYADEVLTMDTEFVVALRSFSDFETYSREKGDSLPQAYEALAIFLQDHHQAFVDAGPRAAEEAMVAARIGRSMLPYIQCALAEDVWEQWLYRDPAMADNVSFLLDELYPDKKIVLWAANGHIFHRNTDIPVYQEQNARSMGTWLVERHRPEMYTVGFYQYKGQAYNLNREIYTVLSPPPNSIEAVFYRARRKYLFVDMLGETQNAGNSWMFEPLNTLLGGLSLVQMVPRDQQDAILFIHTISPADYF